MTIEQIDPKEAYDRMNDQEDPATYLDVRSIQEYEEGHAQGAYNIPLLFRDEHTHQMIPNPNFVNDVQNKFGKDTNLVVGCLMGGRSQRACDALKQVGYQRLANIQGGFGGARDQMGNVIKPGWNQMELPIETGNPNDRAYKK